MDHLEGYGINSSTATCYSTYLELKDRVFFVAKAAAN